MSKKKLLFSLSLLTLCFLLTACGIGKSAASVPTTKPGLPPVVFAAGSAAADSEELRLPLAEGETALLASLPALRSADLSGSTNEEEVAAWAKAHPEIECFYTVTLPDGAQDP